MSIYTLEQIDKYLIDNEYGKPILLPYGDFSITVKTSLSAAEKRTFVDSVVKDSYVNNISYSPIDNKIAFVKTFAQMLTDLHVSHKEDGSNAVDIDRLYAMVNGLSLIANARLTNGFICTLLDELEMCIKHEIDFKNEKIIAMHTSSTASNDAIESVAYLANRTLEGVNKVCDILDNVKDLTQDGKFLKVIPKKKLDMIFEWVQKIVNGLASTIKSENADSNSNIVKFSGKGD